MKIQLLTVLALVFPGVAQAQAFQNYPANVRPQLSNWLALEQSCRGSEVSTAAQEAAVGRICARRDASKVVLRRLNYCYGMQGQASSEYGWHRCRPGSLGY